ncbi:MAG: hypothetical protein RIQ60_3494 [Pseudomonadota bacterium]|jgi:arsenate reductase
MTSGITIYHNPNCSTSRKVLVMIRETGAQPTVIEYLKHPPDRATLLALIAAAGLTPRGLLRRKADAYEALGLAAPTWTDDQIVEFMLNEPVLIERPIVVTPLGTRLCRPVERLLEVLPPVAGGAGA